MISYKKNLIVIFAVGFLLLNINCNKDLGTGPAPGPKWKVYTKASTNGALLDNAVNDISVDAANRIWFATDGGAAILQVSIWSGYTTELEFDWFGQSGGTSRKVNALTQGTDGSTWFALAGGGIRRFNPISSGENWISYGTGVIHQIAADRTGPGGSSNIWSIPFLSGIDRYKPLVSSTENVELVQYTTSSGLPTDHNAITSVEVSHLSRKVWFGTEYGELLSYDGQDWAKQPVSDYDGTVNVIAIEGSNIVWVGTFEGLYRRTTSWTKFVNDTTGNSLPSNIITAIAIDAYGIKWFGTNKGLARFDNANWQVFNTANSPLPSNNINALTIDSDGILWIGTSSGAVAYNPKGTE